MNGTETPRKIYWDACIYLAWLKGEETEHGKVCIDAIRDVAHENFERKAVIVTSTITFIEVLSSHLTQDQERLFRKSFRTTDHVARDVDPPVAMRARDFRQNCINHESGKKLATPDAIHIATASIYEAEFWTFDAGHKDKKHIGLLDLNGDERVAKLKICKPYSHQIKLL